MTDMSMKQVGADFATVRCMVSIARRVDEAWHVIGAFADAGRFLSAPCELVAGDGGIGSVRRIGEEIWEAMVGASAHSYTYVQHRGPMAAYAYHGCVALEAEGSSHCRLVYTIFYDQSAMGADRRDHERARLSARFQGAADAMRRAIEANAAR